MRIEGGGEGREARAGSDADNNDGAIQVLQGFLFFIRYPKTDIICSIIDIIYSIIDITVTKMDIKNTKTDIRTEAAQGRRHHRQCPSGLRDGSRS